jgi:hypothetical protein
MLGIAVRPPPVGALAIDCKPPRQPNEPRAKRSPVAQPPEVAMRFDERVLRDVFRILALPQHTIRDSKGERRRFDEQPLEFEVELVRHGCQSVGKAVNVFLHLAAGANILTSLR